jgi:DNA-binding PadR family transcriptional regulator
MNFKAQKETQTKITKNLLDMIILQHLEKQDMHGYQIITTIRKEYGIYFGPSTVYPLLGLLEKKGVVQSTWNMNSERPRKIYQLTPQGKEFLTATQNTLTMLLQRISPEITIKASTPMLAYA